MVGTISNIISAKKYGFISGENGQEYFFHKEDILGSWDELASDFSQSGAGKIKVNFEPVKNPRGPRARNVTVFEG